MCFLFPTARCSAVVAPLSEWLFDQFFLKATWSPPGICSNNSRIASARSVFTQFKPKLPQGRPKSCWMRVLMVLLTGSRFHIPNGNRAAKVGEFPLLEGLPESMKSPYGWLDVCWGSLNTWLQCVQACIALTFHVLYLSISLLLFGVACFIYFWF